MKFNYPIHTVSITQKSYDLKIIIKHAIKFAVLLPLGIIRARENSPAMTPKAFPFLLAAWRVKIQIRLLYSAPTTVHTTLSMLLVLRRWTIFGRQELGVVFLAC